jgi:eukaryotic-like serine/threonine-protein kinase
MDASDAGRVIGGRYECVELIGRGGMGEVWRARDTLLQRDVAVKRLAYGDGSGDDATVGRSMREARLAARLNHPNAVGIYDVVVDEGLPCLVMELVSGKSLKELVAERPLDPVAAARFGRQVAAALAAAHRVGIIHRDVKPANVLIADDGTAKLTDFGIARDEGDAGMTSTGTFIGTPNFLAPEIALGGNHGPASDVWALGALLYSAVEGDPPFAAGGNALAVLNRIATTDPPVPPHAGPLTSVIAAAMRRDHPDPATRPTPALPRLQAPPVPPHHTPPPHAHTPPPHTPIPHTPPPGSYTPPPLTAPPSFAQGGPFPPPRQYPPSIGYPGPPPDRPPKRRRGWIVAVCGVLAVAAVTTVIVVAATGGRHHEADPTPGPSTTSGPSPTSSTSGVCDDDRTDGTGPALTYVIFAELFDVAGAQACTKPGSVPESFTRSLNGKVFSPAFDNSATDDQADVVRTKFTALDGTKLVVTSTKGDDGKYLVTEARVQ